MILAYALFLFQRSAGDFDDTTTDSTTITRISTYGSLTNHNHASILRQDDVRLAVMLDMNTANVCR